MDPGFIHARWPQALPVRAFTTVRSPEDFQGVSQGPWAGLNLGDHVGDAPGDVAENRRRLLHQGELPEPPSWLNQVHGRAVVELPTAETRPEADAAWTAQAGTVCAILTADCLPVFLAHRDGGAVGLAHAGWRGLADGVLESLLAALPDSPQAYYAWLGPAISATAFQVGEEVRATFLDKDPAAAAAFKPDREGRWLADLNQLAEQRLQAAGIAWVGGGSNCTWQDEVRFYSHRRQAPCGRMASLIWRV